MRSMMPLAALGWTLPRRRILGAPLVLALAAELVYDKLPQASERTAPRPLGARIVAAAVAGGVVARGSRASSALGAVTGALSALASTFLFHRLRARAARRVPPPVAAIGEDLLAIGTATAALQLARAS
jgi:uncharacterized membrane protein